MSVFFSVSLAGKTIFFYWSVSPALHHVPFGPHLTTIYICFTSYCGMLGKVIIMVSVFVLVFGLVRAPAQDTIDKTCQILELEWANDIFMST
ncbi:MAG: hypothetical protein DRJ05_19450, partial [Bacteroidetes bacterium]